VQRRWLVVVVGVAALAVVAVAVAGRPTRACDPAVDRGVLPEWARAGFSGPEPRLSHVVARDGRLAALLLGDPLTAPPRQNRSNKILWVSRTPQRAPSDLRLSAQRMDGDRAVGRPVARTVQRGPGPSIVDLPHAGCWRLHASWAGEKDELDLAYVAGSDR
jgi:hypothetical protein